MQFKFQSKRFCMLLVQDKQMFSSISLSYTYRIPQQDSVGTNKGIWDPLVSGSMADGTQSDCQSVGLKAGITS